MNDVNIRIIDKTLIILWERYSEKLKNNISLTRELVSLLSKMGSSCIEINTEILNMIYPLPIDVEFSINVNDVINIPCGSDFDSVMKKNIKIKKNTPHRVTGLSDLIFYNYEERLLKLKELFGDDMELEILNKDGVGTALAYEWINLGGKSIVGTFTGIGGFVPIEEVLCSLKFIDNRDVLGDTKILPKILEIFEIIMVEKLPTNKPVVGEKIFEVESGIHVDGIIKNPKNYEPYAPSDVGRERQIVLGKHSGTMSLKFKLEQLNIVIEIGRIKILLDIVRDESIKRHRGLDDSEFYDICKGLGAV